MKVQKKKIGIMGGTFDPIHIGHLILAENAKEQYQLDEIYVMPNGNPKYKSDRQVTDVKHRVEMVRLSIEGNPAFTLSTIEAMRQGYTYTYETLEYLKKTNPDDEFYFIIGADSLFSFHNWKYPERIAANCKLLIANRNHMEQEEIDKRIKQLKENYQAEINQVWIPTIEISSEMIRKKVKHQESIRYYVTESTANYIENHQLYGLQTEGVCE